MGSIAAFAQMLAIANVAPVRAQEFPVVSCALSNGMRVLIAEDHHIPRVALHFFFRIGSRNERPGMTGISHFLEHMMFTGAKKYGPGEFDRLTEECGGDNNAYTTPDLTVFTDSFPSSEVERVMDMEADRMRDLRFDPRIVESERRVVAAERNTRIDNDNLGLLYEKLNAASYTAHPYHWPVLGRAEDMAAWDIGDLEAQYRMGYAPGNCVLVVAGDVSAAEIQRLAKKYFESIPAHDPPPPVLTREPQQQEERRVVLARPAQLPVELYTFHSPASNDADYRPLEVLAAILAEGHSSRLYRALVDRGQLANSVSWSQPLTLDPGQLTFGIEGRSGIDLTKLEAAFRAELDRVTLEPVQEQDLERARNQLAMNLYREMKTIAGKAELIGKYETYFGGFQKLFSAARELERVKPADIQRVARKYLARTNCTLAVLMPVDSENQEASE
jgi:zinc protease